MRFDGSTAECVVYAFKDGLLSRVGHDVKIGVQRFEGEIDLAAGVVRVSFDAASVRCLTAMKDGRDNPGALSAKDIRQIQTNLEREVLHPGRWPRIVFESDGVEDLGESFRVRGRLTLTGQTRSMEAVVRRDADALVSEVRLDQTRWGIKPFKALLGALRVQPEVVVRLRVPVPSE